MNVYLDNQSSAYLGAMKVNTSSATALESAKDDALNRLRITLRTGDPIDAGAVLFLVDYYNDSPAAMNEMKQFLYDEGHLAHYLSNNYLSGPITPSLAPLLAHGGFAPDLTIRNQNLYKGLLNGKAQQLAPPAVAIEALARTNLYFNAGSGSVGYSADFAQEFAEHYIEYATDRKLPIEDSLVDAYVRIDVTHAKAFIHDRLLEGNHDSRALMDAYLELNPIDPASSTPWDAMLTGMNLDSGFLGRIGLPSSPLPKLHGWVTLAMKQIKETPLHQPVDKTLLAQLGNVSPMAAAWVAYDRLHRLISDPGRPTLEPALLDAVGAYNKDVLASTANRALEWWLRPTNELMDGDGLPNDGRVRTNMPQIKVDLFGMGGAPQAGDKLKFYLDGTENKTLTLTADDISKGFVLVTPASALNYNQNYTVTTAIESKTDQSLSPLSTPLRIVPDNVGPHTINSYSYALNGKAYGALIFNEPIDGTPNLGGLSVEVRVNGNWQAVPFAVHALGRMVNLELPAGPTAEVRYSIKDTAGNVGSQTLSIALSPNETGPGLLSSYPGPNQLAGMMDHNAYQALHQVDPTAARGWYTRYSNAGLLGLGPAPAPPAPPPGQAPAPGVPGASGSPGVAGPLSAQEIQTLDLETLVHRVLIGRFDRMDELLKEQLANIQKVNEDMAKLTEVMTAVNALVEHVPSEAERSKKVQDLYSGHEPLGHKINAAILAIPGLRLFEENKIDGLYHGGSVTKGGLLAVQQTLKAKLDSMSNLQQHETLRMQMMNSKRLEVLTAISNIMEAASNAKKDILRNMA
ncbi:hypothetical protein [Diaphorobacter nitroreducens]|uniref:hypothetical protein n=1 Tax=Diaphorobacter nitroreducens TaxID=164759 RepID=UPI0035B25AC4